MKLLAHRAGLPGIELLFYIVPLDPAYPALAGRGTCRSKDNFHKQFLITQIHFFVNIFF